MQSRTVPGLQLFCSMPKMPQNKQTVQRASARKEAKLRVWNLALFHTPISHQIFQHVGENKIPGLRHIYLQPPRYCAGYSNLCKNTKTTNYCRGVGSSEWQGAAEGDWEHPSSTASHQQSHQPLIHAHCLPPLLHTHRAFAGSS